MNKDKSTKPGKGKSSPDALTKSSKKANIELTEDELKRVSGGTTTIKQKS